MQTLESILDTSINTVEDNARTIFIRELMLSGWTFPQYNPDIAKKVIEEGVTVKGKTLYISGEGFSDMIMNDFWTEKWDARIWKEIDTIEFDKVPNNDIIIHGKRLIGGKNCPKTFVFTGECRLVANSFENVTIKSKKHVSISLNFYEKKGYTYFKNTRIDADKILMSINDLEQLEQLDMIAKCAFVSFNDDDNQPHIDEEVLNDLKISRKVNELKFNLIRKHLAFEWHGMKWVKYF